MTEKFFIAIEIFKNSDLSNHYQLHKEARRAMLKKIIDDIDFLDKETTPEEQGLIKEEAVLKKTNFLIGDPKMAKAVAEVLTEFKEALKNKEVSLGKDLRSLLIGDVVVLGNFESFNENDYIFMANLINRTRLNET